MNKSESIKNIAIAMNKAQSELGGAHKGANTLTWAQCLRR